MLNKGDWNKKGSHVGMILSFVIFITFLVFLFTILNPALSTGEDKKSLLDYMSVKITDNTSANFSTISVSILSEESLGQNCIRFNDIILELSQVIDVFPPGIIIKNENQLIQTAYYNEEESSAITLDRLDEGNVFFRIYYSEELGTLPSGTCAQPVILFSEDDYEIGSVQIGNYIFLKNIQKLMEEYEANYEDVKNNFNIPPGSEFGLGFTYSNGTKVNVTQETKAPNVYAKETPIQYIDDEAKVLSGFLNLEVW